MTVNELVEKLNAKIINLSDGNRSLSTGYAGDFLSFVMGRAPTDCAWFTVMNNVNVAAVASLADVSVIVLCEGVEPDETLLKTVKEREINTLCTKLDAFNAIREYLK